MGDNILTFRFSSTGRVQLNEHGLYCSTSVAQSFRLERDELLRIVSGLREQLETERANDEVREAETEWEIELLRTQIKTQADDLAVLAGAIEHIREVAIDKDPNPNVTRVLVPKYGQVWHAINTLSAKATAILDREKEGK